MTNADLRKLALAATPGEWEVGSYGPNDKHVRTCDEYAHLKKDGTEKKIPRPDKLVVATTCDALFSTRPPFSRAEADAAFIAAANPARVLALLDALAAKDAETERLKRRLKAVDVVLVRHGMDANACGFDIEAVIHADHREGDEVTALEQFHEALSRVEEPADPYTAEVRLIHEEK